MGTQWQLPFGFIILFFFESFEEFSCVFLGLLVKFYTDFKGETQFYGIVLFDLIHLNRFNYLIPLLILEQLHFTTIVRFFL